MTSQKLVIYRGKLSIAQIVEGMNAAASNARRLAEDAATLLEVGSFPTAASLAILSLEEFGKIRILKNLALATSDGEIAKAWKDYRRHTRKIRSWLLWGAIAGQESLTDMLQAVASRLDYPVRFDLLKQLGLYTDCIGQAEWSTPSDRVSEKIAAVLVELARLHASNECEHTEREIELWIEYVKPVLEGRCNPTESLWNWHAAMQKEGLISGEKWKESPEWEWMESPILKEIMRRRNLENKDGTR